MNAPMINAGTWFTAPWQKLCRLPGQLKARLGNTLNGEAALSDVIANDAGQGQVYLIGAGPGDWELLTLKAWRLLHQADVVLYDWLVSEELLAQLPRTVKPVFVGKRCGRHSYTQDDICQLMVSYAQQGLKVARLKGGDPSVFGRLGEELDALTEAGIPNAVVPGVTAASGCAAYTGIPLTERDCAPSVRFITAQFKEAARQPDWQELVTSDTSKQPTLVFYMGLTRIQQICDGLIVSGMDAEMPVAVVESGTTQMQKLCTGTLTNIRDLIAKADIEGPALIIVGKVVTKQRQVDLQLLQHTIGSSIHGRTTHYV